MISIIKFSKEFYKPKSKTLEDIQELAEDLGLEYQSLYTAFTIYTAHFILFKFKKAIDEQKVNGKTFKSQYKSLSKRYKAQKPSATRNKFWIQNGDLFNQLGVYATRGKIVHIGFRGNKRFIKDKPKVDLRNNLMWVEYGTKKMKARPLLRPIVAGVRKNIPWLWERYKRLLYDNNNQLEKLIK